MCNYLTSNKNKTFAVIITLLSIFIFGTFFKQMLWPFIPYDMYAFYVPNQSDRIDLKLITIDDKVIFIECNSLLHQTSLDEDSKIAILFFKKHDPAKLKNVLNELKNRSELKYGKIKKLYAFRKIVYRNNTKLSDIEFVGETE